MKKAWAALLVLIPLIFVLFPQKAEAKPRNDSVGYGFAAVGVNYTFGGARIGRNSVELGVFPAGVGISYVARNSSNNAYTAVGIATFGSLALFGGVGYEIPIFSFLQLRAEAQAYGSFQGKADMAALVGVNAGL